MAKDRSFQQVFADVCTNIRNNGSEERHFKEFAKLRTNRFRVEYVLNHMRMKDYLSKGCRTSKNLKNATQLKAEGNKEYQREMYAEALHLYNQAMQLAVCEPDDNTLAICFANRSAVMLHLGFYEQCLRDIEAAMLNGYPENMTYKLHIRKTKCLQMTGSMKAASSLEDAIESLMYTSLPGKERRLREKELNVLAEHQKMLSFSELSQHKPVSLDKCNEIYTALSPAITVTDNSEFGRHIKAVSTVLTGDVCLIEKPYCSVPTCEHFLTHCTHCQKRVHSLYPCRGCADIAYCDSNCESTAWEEYHQYECAHILNIQRCDISMGHLALRAAIKAGYPTLKNVTNTEQIDQSTYSSEDYCNIYKLQSHEEDRSSQDLFWRSNAAVFLAYYVDIEKWSKACDALETLAEFTLHHMQAFPCNAHEIYEVLYDTAKPSASQIVEIGAGIYATLSLFNHSCDPSVVRVFHAGNTCVVKALSPIAPGQQVYDNYGALYAVSSPEERQTKLRDQYYFECSCNPCIHQWPLYASLSYAEEPIYLCRKCNSVIYDEACDRCETKLNKQSVNTVLARAKLAFDQDLHSLFSGTFALESVDQLEKKFALYSNLVNKLVVRPYKTLNDCQEALKHVLGLQGNVTAVTGKQTHHRN